MGSVREPPREFEALLKRKWPDFRRIEWDQTYSRWRFFFTSAAGREASLLYTWDRDPHTGGEPQRDPLTGLLPFRDLDAQAQAEIIYHGDRTALTNPQDGAGTWERATRRQSARQRAEHKRRRDQQSADYAYALQQVDLRRPWLRDHQPDPNARFVIASGFGKGPRRAEEAV